ncbi:BaiN/RdsA family NAD(P)/FAD-dependent oxidoreductase [Flavicella sediminum]|uniref:NAD(P)/FAD-dependent oxidoreductase n=1 Tax=Flavicella sediminum TaxID=2585141 RepID=UPI0011206502|nr:TIGR03862 family flavoprotein [Flavicella sediminum]
MLQNKTHSTSSLKKILIIGGGPAGMMAAIELSKTHEVHVFEKGKTLGRKFLVAGKGGFNLSNSATEKSLFEKYSPQNFLEPILKKFDSTATVKWLKYLGIPTYVGSSGRIFPEKGIKPIEVLNALKNKMLAQKVQLHFEHEFIDFNKEQIHFIHQQKKMSIPFETCIFALGGASWSVTGSKGDWLTSFEKNAIQTIPFEASNCGIICTSLQKEFLEQFEGFPLKNITITCNNKLVKGEALISTYGLEGNAIYPISAEVRKNLHKNSSTSVFIDLKPFNSAEELQQKITATTKPKNYKYLFNLNKVQLALIKNFSSKEHYMNPTSFVELLKKLEIPISGLRPMEEAISTVGGIALEELNLDLSLKKIPNIYIAGEMFDWDTQTGGYLLQACFATGYHVAQNILARSTKNF